MRFLFVLRYVVLILLVTTLFFLPFEAKAFWGAVATGIAAGGAGCYYGLAFGPWGCAIGAGIGLVGGFFFGDWLTGGTISVIADIVNWIAQGIIGLILPLVLNFLHLGILFSTDTISDFQPVLDATAVARSVANLLLVAILIIIAMATIVNIESYGVRKILPLLIGIALIVNFSTIFVGLVADTGNTVMRFFWNNSGFTTVPLDKYIIQNMKISQASAEESVDTIKNILKETGAGDFSHTSSAALKATLYLIIILMGLLAIYVFLRMAILFIIRVAALWILIMTAPIVFILGIIPVGRGYLTSWWQQLFNWAFVGPVMFFFLFFGLIIWTELNRLFAGGAPITGGTAALPVAYAQTATSAANREAFSLFLIFPAVSLFFIYALNISKKMAGAAANAVVDSVISLGKSVTLGGAALATGAVLSGVGGAILKSPRVGRLAEGLKATRFGRGIGSRLGTAHKDITDRETRLAQAESGAWEDVVGGWDQAKLERNLSPRSFRDGRQRQAIALAALSKNVPFSQTAYGSAKKLATKDSRLEKELKKSYLQYDTSLRAGGTAAGQLDLGKVATRVAKENINTELMLQGAPLKERVELTATTALLWDRGDMNRIARERPDLLRDLKSVHETLAKQSDVAQQALYSNIARRTGRDQEEVRKAMKQQGEWLKSSQAQLSGGYRWSPPGATPTPTAPTA